MDKQELIITIYGLIWAGLIFAFGMFLVPDKCDKLTYVIVSNASFVLVTAIIIFIKPIRKWIYKTIINK